MGKVGKWLYCIAGRVGALRNGTVLLVNKPFVPDCIASIYAISEVRRRMYRMLDKLMREFEERRIHRDMEGE